MNEQEAIATLRLIRRLDELLGDQPLSVEDSTLCSEVMGMAMAAHRPRKRLDLSNVEKFRESYASPEFKSQWKATHRMKGAEHVTFRYEFLVNFKTESHFTNGPGALFSSQDGELIVVRSEDVPRYMDALR